MGFVVFEVGISEKGESAKGAIVGKIFHTRKLKNNSKAE